ncbi:MAG: alpha-ribazole-5-phosphate synthase [Eubacteriaceae bacterium]|nr:alpha-ribazole-5-phosphate synthase [Eubacteriaceae bacterium]
MRQSKKILFTSSKRRDLTVAHLPSGMSIVIASDSIGSIGQKPNDMLACPAETVGAMAARVALLEVICSGAVPVSLHNVVANEMHPTASRMIEGIKGELGQARLGDIDINGSTEENFDTSMSAVGVTVVGIAQTACLRFGKSYPGDMVVIAGKPLVGAEVLDDTAGAKASYGDAQTLLDCSEVREIVPVGSKGIAYEAQVLANLNGLACELCDVDGIDFGKSGGPATCLIASISAKGASELQKYPVIGTFSAL